MRMTGLTCLVGLSMSDRLTCLIDLMCLIYSACLTDLTCLINLACLMDLPGMTQWTWNGLSMDDRENDKLTGIPGIYRLYMLIETEYK